MQKGGGSGVKKGDTKEKGEKEGGKGGKGTTGCDVDMEENEKMKLIKLKGKSKLYWLLKCTWRRESL